MFGWVGHLVMMRSIVNLVMVMVCFLVGHGMDVAFLNVTLIIDEITNYNQLLVSAVTEHKHAT